MSPRARKRRGNRSGGRPPQHKRQQGADGGQRQPSGPDFWGDPAALPEPRRDVRITEEPSTVVRSLGPPPLSGHETIAAHYFRAVYDRAVMLSGALAAAGELITPEDLLEELED
jgi:hypothetical protein